MKPSELIKSYILSKQLPKQQNELSKYFECCFERLDNKFIDREELKEKINERICQINDCLGELSYTKKYEQIQKERVILLKEVLELLK